MRSIHLIEYIWPQKGIKLMHATEMNLEDIMLSEINQSQKVKNYVSPLI